MMKCIGCNYHKFKKSEYPESGKGKFYCSENNNSENCKCFTKHSCLNCEYCVNKEWMMIEDTTMLLSCSFYDIRLEQGGKSTNGFKICPNFIEREGEMETVKYPIDPAEKLMLLLLLSLLIIGVVCILATAGGVQ